MRKTLAAVALLPVSALAQTTATLPPVVITATRVETPPFDVPAAIDRIGGDTVRVGAKLTGAGGGIGYVADVSRFRTDGYRDHSAVRRDIGNVKLTGQPDSSSKLTVVANSVALPKAEDPLGLTRAQWDANP